MRAKSWVEWPDSGALLAGGPGGVRVSRVRGAAAVLAGGAVWLLSSGCVDTEAPKPPAGDTVDGGPLLAGDLGLGPGKPSSMASLANVDSGAPVKRLLPSETGGQGSARPAPASNRSTGTSGSPAAIGGRGVLPDARPGMDAADGGEAFPSLRPRTGALVISEVMADPKAVTDADGEWFELWNPNAEPFALEGCAIADGSAQLHPISAPVVVAAHAGVSIARTEHPGFAPDVVASFSLKNGADVLALVCGEVTIDRVEYDKTRGFPIKAGVAMSLDARYLEAARNDLAETWCLALDPYSDDLGTPGRPNPECGDDGDAGIFADVRDTENIDAQRDP
jgi:hypothetical protein